MCQLLAPHALTTVLMDIERNRNARTHARTDKHTHTHTHTHTHVYRYALTDECNVKAAGVVTTASKKIADTGEGVGSWEQVS